MPFKVKQRDIAKIVKKSKEPLQPIFEAVQNSIESVFLAKKKGLCTNPYVKITFCYKAVSDLFFNTITTLEKIEIEDNGEGFDEINLDRFQSLFDTSKNFRNKGTGKLQIFHRFGDIEVKSRYVDGDDIVGVEFKALEIMENGSSKDYNNPLFHTIVSLIDPLPNTVDEYAIYKEVDKLYSEITEHFFLSLSLSEVIPIYCSPLILKIS